MDEEMIDEQVWDINREKAYMAPQRIELVTQYILEHFDTKTYRGDKTYVFNALTNISEVASAGKSQVEEIKRKQRLSGFNSIFAVASVDMAKLYYAEFQRQMATDPSKSLFKISTCMDWRVDFLPCKAKIRRHPDGWQGFLTQSGRKIRRQDMRGEILNRL